MRRTMFRRVATVGVALAALAGLATLPADAGANDYGNADYLSHELDNLSRSSLEGTQVEQLLDPAFLTSFLQTGAETWTENLGEQLAALPYGRIFGGLGQLLPGGAVGDPKAYHEIEPIEANFVSRTGAMLQGHLFWDGLPGPHPGVVVTSGSIQGFQQGYWWAARTLARQGYVVLTWDAQGQGDSEVFGHEPGSILPTGAGFPFQQAPNFIDGTVDALRFFLSTEVDPYVPGTWSAADAAATKAQGEAALSWSNPLEAAIDPTRVGLAGHSLGASAVSTVQQCSDLGTTWQTAAVCGGRSFPIKAIVAWDGLCGTCGPPVVPAMNQSADGYFLAPVPSFSAPDPASELGSYLTWKAAGVDTYSYVVRGGTHLEWFQVPYLLPTTTYGQEQADYYTLAWFERYLRPEADRQAAGAAALLAGPIPDGLTGGSNEQPQRANFFSARRLSAFSFTDTLGVAHEADDLRVYAGLSPVGDWAGANADDPKARLAG